MLGEREIHSREGAPVVGQSSHVLAVMRSSRESYESACRAPEAAFLRFHLRLLNLLREGVACAICGGYQRPHAYGCDQRCRQDHVSALRVCGECAGNGFSPYLSTRLLFTAV